MESLKINYYNLNDNKIQNLIQSNKKINKKISDEVLNLYPLKICRDENLLNEIILQSNNFAQNKNKFIVFGTGGSNLGARALINILLGNEKKKIYFCDNIDPNNFKNFIEKHNEDSVGYIIISKSGHTPETLCQFSCLIEMMVRF